MNKFKVGDKVRYKDDHDWKSIRGVSGIITEIDTPNHYYVKCQAFSGSRVTDHTYKSNEKELELDQPYLNEQKLKKVLGLE